jgi:hypothetical protein
LLLGFSERIHRSWSLQFLSSGYLLWLMILSSSKPVISLLQLGFCPYISSECDPCSSTFWGSMWLITLYLLGKFWIIFLADVLNLIKSTKSLLPWKVSIVTVSRDCMGTSFEAIISQPQTHYSYKFYSKFKGNWCMVHIPKTCNLGRGWQIL